MKRSKFIKACHLSVINEKSKLLKNIESTDALKIACLKHASQKLLQFKNVSLFYGDKKFVTT